MSQLSGYSWDCNDPSELTKWFLELMIEESRSELISTFSKSRNDIDEKSKLISKALIAAKREKWISVSSIWNPALFILQRDKSLKLIVERLIDTNDPDKIESALKDACLLIFETLHKTEALFGRDFYRAIKTVGIQDDAINEFNACKKKLNQFGEQHNPSLKKIRDNLVAHIDTDSLLHEYLSSTLARHAITKLAIDFGKLLIEISSPIQTFMSASAEYQAKINQNLYRR
jgi:hypothetical protein